MEFFIRRSPSALFPFFSPRSVTEPIIPSQPESPTPQLTQLIEKQKRVNNLIYVCDSDTNGKLNCRWVKACPL